MESPDGGSSPCSPPNEPRNFEDKLHYMRSPGSESSQNVKNIEANPQDDMQCQKMILGSIGGSKIQSDKKEPL